MLRKAAATLAVATATILLLQCSRDKATSPQAAPLGEPVQIQLGQQVVFGAEEFRVTFKSVNFDQRCVGAAECIWDGLAEATFSLRTAEGQGANLDLAIAGQTTAEEQYARSRQSLGFRVILSNLQPVGAGQAKDATPTATVIVKAGDLDSPSHIESVVIADAPNEKMLGRDVVISAPGLRGDTLVLQTQTNGTCLQHYFALFAANTLTGATGDELNLYLKHTSQTPTCIGTANQEVKFVINALRQFLTDDLQEVQLHIFGCRNSLASGPQHLLFPYGNYLNRPPVLGPIGLQHFQVDVEKRVAITASDPDGPRPAITITGMPQNSRIERGFDTTYFVFQPTESQLGWHSIFVAASDGSETDSERVALHVTQTGANVPPVLAVLHDTTIREGEELELEIIATDADSDPVTVEVQGLPQNAHFWKASGDDYRLYFQPTFDQAAYYGLLFQASDGIEVDTALLFITVTNFDRPPVIEAPAGVNRVRFGERLQFFIRAADPDGDVTTLHCQNLPEHASLIPGQSDYWKFTFDPDSSQVGSYDLQFVALSTTLADTAVVRVEVFDNSNTVTIAPVPPQEVTEGDSLVIAISAVSSRGAPIDFRAEQLGGLGIWRFTDFHDGHAEVVVKPGYTQAGEDSFQVIAQDYYDVDTAIVDVAVFEAGDQPPRFSGVSVVLYAMEGTESDHRIFVSDPDGELAVCELREAPEFVELVLTNNRWYLHLPSPYPVAGTYAFMILAYDPDIVSVTDTLAVTLTVHPLQQNSGSLLPMEVGNYWIYDVSSYGSGGCDCAYVESVAVIGKTVTDTSIIYRFSGSLGCHIPATVSVADGRVMFNDFDLNDLLSGSPSVVLVPAGAFATCYSGRSSFWFNGQDVMLFAPGVGIVGASRSYYSVHSDDYINFRAVLLRYHIGQ